MRGTVAVVAIQGIRKSLIRQSGTALVGTRSDPLPALAGEGLRDEAVITFCGTAGISARAEVLGVGEVRDEGV